MSKEMDVEPYIKIVKGICELFEKEIYEENLNPLMKAILTSTFLELGKRISEQIVMFNTVNENNESNLNILKLGVRVAKIGMHLSEFLMEFLGKAENSSSTEGEKSKKEEEIIH